MTWENTTKIRVLKDYWLQRHQSSCSTVFLRKRFLNYLDMALNYRRNQNTTSKPEYKSRYFKGIQTLRQNWMTNIASKPCVQKRTAGACKNGVRGQLCLNVLFLGLQRGPNTGGNNFQSLFCKAFSFIRGGPFCTYEPSKSDQNPTQQCVPRTSQY